MSCNVCRCPHHHQWPWRRAMPTTTPAPNGFCVLLFLTGQLARNISAYHWQQCLSLHTHTHTYKQLSTCVNVCTCACMRNITIIVPFCGHLVHDTAPTIATIQVQQRANEKQTGAATIKSWKVASALVRPKHRYIAAIVSCAAAAKQFHSVPQRQRRD